jgi:hypothetical protein
MTTTSFDDTHAIPADHAWLTDPSTSYWLRAQIVATAQRDPVDALRDAERLVEVLRLRCDRALADAGR